jgi:glycosyltransferase involved in cell wall biosynthesis
VRIAFISQPRDYIAASGVQRGSVAIVTWELASRLAKSHNVTIYAPLGHGQAAEELGEGLMVRRVRRAYRTVHKALDLGIGLVGGQPPYFTRLAYFHEYASAVADWLRADPPDCIHVQIASQFIPLFRHAVPAARIVLHVHDELLTRVDRQSIAVRIAMADAVVTCSDYITSRWQQRFEPFASRIFTVRNGVDLMRFRPQPSPPFQREILYVGRISPEKGVHVLASAFDQVVESIPDARLTLAGAAGLLPFSQISLLSNDSHVAALREFYGAGVADKLRRQILHPYNSYLESVRSRLSPRAAANVEILGDVEYQAMPDLYRRAAVLAAPSVLAEPFGLPLVEAMACGRPVVASRAGGMAETVIDGVTGRLVERGDVIGLADALRDVLTNDEARERMQKAARSVVEERYSWDKSVERLDEIYRGRRASPQGAVSKRSAAESPA